MFVTQTLRPYVESHLKRTGSVLNGRTLEAASQACKCCVMRQGLTNALTLRGLRILHLGLTDFAKRARQWTPGVLLFILLQYRDYKHIPLLPGFYVGQALTLGKGALYQPRHLRPLSPCIELWWVFVCAWGTVFIHSDNAFTKHRGVRTWTVSLVGSIPCSLKFAFLCGIE